MGTWNPVWEDIFNKRESWGYYPPEELVRFIARNYYAKPDRAVVRILEIGCGPGGGPSWYISREGFSFYGIDGSPTAIAKARKRFKSEGLQGEFTVGDIEQLPWTDETFDCVVDVACLQQNSEEAAGTIIREVYRVLKPGGRHFSLTTRKGCWGDATGIPVDNTSFRDVEVGPFANMGTVRFATKESLLNLYAGFQNMEFEYSIRSMNNGKNEIANWVVTCQK